MNELTPPPQEATHCGPFFADLTDAFEEASSEALISERIDLGGHLFEVRFAGASLVESVMPALRHLRTIQSGSPAFTIDVFDTSSTGVGLGPPPWGPHDYLARGEIRGFNENSWRTAYRVDCGVLTMADLEARRGVFWIRDPSYYPEWMRAAPLRNLFGWWAAYNGLQLVHGAAVGMEGRAALISAPGGSGKSTTAVRAALEGMAFLGDDYVMVDPNRLRVHSIYSSAKMDRRAIEEFAPHVGPYSRGLVGEPGSEKHFFLATDIFPSAVVRSQELVALVIPDLDRSIETEVVDISLGDALSAVAPTSLFQLEGSSAEDFSTIAGLVRSLPLFQLRIGRTGGVAAHLTDLLRRVAA